MAYWIVFFKSGYRFNLVFFEEHEAIALTSHEYVVLETQKQIAVRLSECIDLFHGSYVDLKRELDLLLLHYQLSFESRTSLNYGLDSGIEHLAIGDKCILVQLVLLSETTRRVRHVFPQLGILIHVLTPNRLVGRDFQVLLSQHDAVVVKTRRLVETLTRIERLPHNGRTLVSHIVSIYVACRNTSEVILSVSLVQRQLDV